MLCAFALVTVQTLSAVWQTLHTLKEKPYWGHSRSYMVNQRANFETTAGDNSNRATAGGSQRWKLYTFLHSEPLESYRVWRGSLLSLHSGTAQRGSEAQSSRCQTQWKHANIHRKWWCGISSIATKKLPQSVRRVGSDVARWSDHAGSH